MIKILKEGNVIKFTKTCPKCGCEFEYDKEDLHTDHTLALTTYPCQFSQYVICPWCGEHIFHGYTTEGPFKFPDVIYTSGTTNWPDCETCPNKPDPTKTIVGDTPCTWCKKNTPYCTSFTKE